MPIYEYTCNICGHEDSRLVRMSDPPPTCEKCVREGRTSQQMTKKISLSGFKLEGGGWAKDGYG